MITANEKLRRARMEKHWSIAVASRRVGVSTNTFNRWERGLQVPQMATLDQLCDAFQMSAESLGFSVFSRHKKIEVALLVDGDVEIATMQHDRLPDATAVDQSEHGSPPIIVNPIQKSSAALRLLRGQSDLSHEDGISRRKLIARLIGSPAAAFGLQHGDTPSLLRAEEILALCSAHIPLCWQLYFEGGLLDVGKVLPSYIAQLSILVEQPSSYQKRAASLLSQALQLASLLGTQHQDYGTAYRTARQALLYGEMAEDQALQVASSLREALVSFYLKRALPRYYVYQRALPMAAQTSPLLQGRVYAGLAEVCSLLNQEDKAWRFLELAQETFPRQPEDEPCFAYTHITFNSVSSFEGRMYLNLQQPAQAWRAFARIDQILPSEAIPNRLELTIHQAMTACALGELEQTRELLEVAVPMAREIGSQLRVDEAYEVYEQMLTKWGKEPGIRELEELFLLT